MRHLTRDEIVSVLRQADVVHVAVVDGDRPYVAPMSFVFMDDMIVFRTGAGRRLDALRDNPNVSLAVTTVDAASGTWRSVVISGRARPPGRDADPATVVTRLLAKYRAAYGVMSEAPDWLTDDAVIVEVVIDEMSGRATDDDGSLRPGRL